MWGVGFGSGDVWEWGEFLDELVECFCGCVVGHWVVRYRSGCVLMVLVCIRCFYLGVGCSGVYGYVLSEL